jgi:hypothetical protein
MDVEVIKQVPISHTTQHDFWAWNYEKNGVFSVRSPYNMMVETKYRRESWLDGRADASNTAEKEDQWKKLWKTRVPSKLRIFAWRLARSSLPTGQERVHRHMATTAICPICNAAEDDWRHSLISCNMAKAVWALWDDDVVLPMCCFPLVWTQALAACFCLGLSQALSASHVDTTNNLFHECNHIRWTH